MERSHIRTWCCLMAQAALALVLTASASAEAPALIRYQGEAIDSQGVPLEGPHRLTFRLYDAETGGAVHWQEVQPDVVLAEGRFGVLLGSVAPLSGMDWSVPCWLSVQLDANPELAPRQRITAVPVAIMARELEGPITTVGNNVGVGTDTPAELLHVAGNQFLKGALMLDGSGGTMSHTSPPAVTEQAYVYRSSQDGSLVLQSRVGSEVPIRFWTGLSEKMTLFGNGNLAIGASTAGGYKVYVNGPLYATTVSYGSSRAWKTDIVPFTNAEYAGVLDQVRRTKVVRFRWKEDLRMDGGTHVGVIAEEAPAEMRAQSGDAIGVPEAMGFLMAGLKALAAECEQLRARVVVLEGEAAPQASRSSAPPASRTPPE